MTIKDGILEGFEPKFDSVNKDDERYSDALHDLIEANVIQPRDYIEHSCKGSLWIAYQYIDKGHLDLIEDHITKVPSKEKNYGPLFRNTHAILMRLFELSEYDRVFSVYRAEIRYRLKALKEEAADIRRLKPRSHDWKAKKEWVNFYLPTTKTMVEDYKDLLGNADRPDPDVEFFEGSIDEIEKAASAFNKKTFFLF